MKNIVLAGVISIFALTACKKNQDSVAEKTLEQQKMDFQVGQLEIEKQKLAIERERFQYETQKRADSIAIVEKEKAKTAAAAKPKLFIVMHLDLLAEAVRETVMELHKVQQQRKKELAKPLKVQLSVL